VFEPLAAPALRVIAQRMLTQSALRLSEKSAVLRWDEHALDALCARCRDGAMGARPLRRMIAREAEEKACRLLLQRGQDGALSMLLTAHDGALALECDRCPQAAGSS